MWQVILIAALSAQAYQSELPKGWKTAKPVEQSGCDDRAKSPSGLFVANGDFDGDGKEDHARLLARQSGKGLAVWVWPGRGGKPMLAAEAKGVADGAHDMAIAVAAKGTVDTACGKGYATECTMNAPPQLELEHDGIRFFTCESAARIVHWNKKTKRFFETWLSD